MHECDNFRAGKALYDELGEDMRFVASDLTTALDAIGLAACAIEHVFEEEQKDRPDLDTVSRASLSTGLQLVKAQLETLLDGAAAVREACALRCCLETIH